MSSKDFFHNADFKFFQIFCIKVQFVDTIAFLLNTFFSNWNKGDDRFFFQNPLRGEIA